MKTDWDKLETDVLFELCERFSLRFIVIADRFNYELAEQEAKRDCTALPKSKLRKRDQKVQAKRVVKDRTVDEIKDRYYSVSKEIFFIPSISSNYFFTN